MKNYCFMIALLICSSLPLVGISAEVPGKKHLISLNFTDTPLGTVLTILTEKTGYKLITDQEMAKRRIAFKLDNVTTDDALNALLDTYNLYFVRQGDTNIYVVKSKSDAVMTTVTKVFFLSFSTARDLDGVLKQNLSKNGSISSDMRSNSLIITDVADNIDKMEILIKSLDSPPQQVLLEANIIDMKLDSAFQIGSEITSLSNTSVMPKYEFQQTLSQGLSAGGKLSVSILNNDFNVRGFIDAVKKDTNAKILTNPKLLVLNNQEANIDIIEEVPYEESSISTAGSAIATTKFKEVGIKLRVKPQINRDGTIILMVTPEQSFRTGESISNVPVISTSKANTTFILNNGETAVIGGMVRNSNSRTEYKIPILGDIPLIGFLFKKYDTERVRTELTILISAKIIVGHDSVVK
ncbi:MAG: hypothetical protein LHV68_09010 [Elusimicrobia bacterium]|nr:hypothetical protein [Candidatus Liberimonas magnetica]